jgi:hypothetical protein
MEQKKKSEYGKNLSSYNWLLKSISISQLDRITPRRPMQLPLIALQRNLTRFLMVSWNVIIILHCLALMGSVAILLFPSIEGPEFSILI